MLTYYRKLFLFFLSLFAIDGFAIEASLRVSTGLEYSDNMALNSDQKEDDVLQTVGFDLGVLGQGKHIQLDVNVSASHSKYYDKTYSDETSLGAGLGVLNIGLVESFLDWRSSFRRTDVITDSSNRYNPDSKEFRNIYRTGPFLSYQISPVSHVGFSSAYVVVENSDPDVSDSERIENNLGWNYWLSSITQLSLNGAYSNVTDGDELDTFANANANVGVSRRISKGQVSLNVGKTRFIPESGDYREGNFFDLRFDHEAFLWHQWMLQYYSNISDTSIGFIERDDGETSDDPSSQPEEAPAQSNQIDITGTDVLERRQFRVRLRRDLGSVTYELEALHEEEDYFVQRNDQEAKRVDLRLGNVLNAQWRVGVALAWQSDDFLEAPSQGRDITTSYEVNARYSFSRDLYYDGFVRFEKRENSGNAVREYEAASIGARITWQAF